MVNPALTLSGLVSIALPIVIILIVLFILFKLGKCSGVRVAYGLYD